MVGSSAGGKIVIACWCQREETAEQPLSPSDKSKLQFLYDEWAHPFFVSYQQFARLLQVIDPFYPASLALAHWPVGDALTMAVILQPDCATCRLCKTLMSSPCFLFFPSGFSASCQ